MIKRSTIDARAAIQAAEQPSRRPNSELGGSMRRVTAHITIVVPRVMFLRGRATKSTASIPDAPKACNCTVSGLTDAKCRYGHLENTLGYEVGERHGRLAVAGDMNVYSAAELKATLLSAVSDRRGEAIIDLSDVSEIDTAGLQVLLLLRRLARASGRRFAIVDPSAPVADVLDLCGLATTIERPDRTGDAQ
jgi:anti-anti-sigma factor